MAAVVALSIVGGLAGAALGSTQVSLETVIYSWQKTEAQVFFTGEFGTFADNPPLAEFVDMGSNRVSFGLTEDYQRESFIQRLDPCNCPSGVSVGRIGLASPFAYEAIDAESWIAGGSNEFLIPDANMQLVQNRLLEADPQIVFYADVPRFIQHSTVVGAATGFVLVLLLSGLVTLTLLVARRRKGQSAHAGSRRSLRNQERHLGNWVVWVAGLFIVLGSGQMLWGAHTTGITIDEGYHVDHLQNFLDGGSYSIASYGPASSLLGHAVNISLGFETWGLVSGEPEAFAGRHLATAFLGILAIGAVGMTVGLALRSLAWGMTGSALLASLPLWTGHSMFNGKDVPAGAGYALFVAALAWLMMSRSALWPRLAFGVILGGAGLVVGVGTRPGLWPLFLGTGAMAILLSVVAKYFARSTDSAMKRGKIMASFIAGFALIVGATIGLLLFTEAGRELAAAVTTSLDHPWSKSRRYDGVRVYNRPEALFVFRILLSQIPAFVAFLFGAGTIAGIAVLWRDVRSGVHLSGVGRIFPLAAIQVFAPFLVVAVFSPVLYDGIRQILFILPGVAVISALGLWGLFRSALWLFGLRQSVAVGTAIAVALLLALISVDQLRLFPYNYVYVNEVAQAHGVSGAWESDYWDSSNREAIEQAVAVDDPITCGFTHQAMVNLSDIRKPCITISPYLPGLAQSSKSLLGDREFWTIRSERNLLQYGPPPFNCFPESAVTRPLRSETLVMSRLYRCIDY